MRMCCVIVCLPNEKEKKKGYLLCMMGDFQNRLTSGIFGVFSSGFLHRTTVNNL